MVQQGSPARRVHAPVRWYLRITAALFIIMALGARRHSADNSGSIVRAAEYIRMSTDHQQYSTENQHDAIQACGPQLVMKIRGFSTVHQRRPDGFPPILGNSDTGNGVGAVPINLAAHEESLTCLPPC